MTCSNTAVALHTNNLIFFYVSSHKWMLSAITSMMCHLRYTPPPRCVICHGPWNCHWVSMTVVPYLIVRDRMMYFQYSARIESYSSANCSHSCNKHVTLSTQLHTNLITFRLAFICYYTVWVTSLTLLHGVILLDLHVHLQYQCQCQCNTVFLLEHLYLKLSSTCWKSSWVLCSSV